ncbi:MAG: hypothetical protein ABI743_05720 [bacterium]
MYLKLIVSWRGIMGLVSDVSPTPASPSPSPAHRGVIDWGYILGWALACLLVGYGTYWVVQTNPAGYPTDRRDADAKSDTTGHSVVGNLMMQALDPATNTVTWELRVPNSSGSVTEGGVFQDPAIVLFPSSRQFRITATSGTIHGTTVGPDGAVQSSEVEMKLAGPIEGASADGQESFEADSAEWVGATRQLTLHGSPLVLHRGPMVLKAERIVVTAETTGSLHYDLTGSVEVTGE